LVFTKIGNAIDTRLLYSGRRRVVKKGSRYEWGIAIGKGEGLPDHSEEELQVIVGRGTRVRSAFQAADKIDLLPSLSHHSLS